MRRISVITINKDNSGGLARTLNSVSGQLSSLKDAGVNLEYIVVDGLSTDGSLIRNREALEALNARIVSAKPRGVYNAINEGLRLCTGEVAGLLHAGDVFTEDTVLSRIISVFQGETDADYIYGDVGIGRRYYSGEGFTAKTALTGFAPPHPSLYVRRKVMSKVGDYDESLKVAADFDYFLRLLHTPGLKGRYLPVKMVEMETGGMSQSFKNRLWTNNTERLMSLRKNGLPASRLRLAAHYVKILKSLCSSKPQ